MLARNSPLSMREIRLPEQASRPFGCTVFRLRIKK